MRDSFKTRQSLAVGSQSYEIFSLPAIKGHDLGRLPFSLKILLENLLRTEDGVNVTHADIEALLKWDAKAAPSHEIAFTPARVIMQDFTGVPAIVDLAAMREAMTRLGGNPQEINPLAAGGTRHRPLRAGRRVRRPRRAAQEQHHRVRPQRRALLVPALGPDGLQQLQGGAAEHRHRAPGEHRAPRARGLRRGQERLEARLPGHRGRHRLAHHDGQRPRRARLGRGRHRGGGRHARPARDDADPAGHRLPAQGRAAARAPRRPTSC